MSEQQTLNPFLAARAVFDALCIRLVDDLLPRPFFWLGADAEWPELVFPSANEV